VRACPVLARNWCACSVLLPGFPADGPATDGGACRTCGSDSPAGSQRQCHPDHPAGRPHPAAYRTSPLCLGHFHAAVAPQRGMLGSPENRRRRVWRSQRTTHHYTPSGRSFTRGVRAGTSGANGPIVPDDRPDCLPCSAAAYGCSIRSHRLSHIIPAVRIHCLHVQPRGSLFRMGAFVSCEPTAGCQSAHSSMASHAKVCSQRLFPTKC